ncbi:MAG TPA: hypothetical protein VG603_15730 [Chitinophagales bacterium]|nr:hypothetical protein [Chitinophagales bacterium]
MELRITKNAWAVCAAMLLFIFQASAQNKDIDKGKEELTKALDQKDASKKQDGISKARELFQKGGMKPQEISVTLGDAYLSKGDLQNAANNYNAAGKEEKKEGLKKVADAYVDAAFAEEDEKKANRDINYAMKYYGKADATEEGARGIGDKYYEKGADSYDKALQYYLIGGANAKVEQIAKEYFEKGGDNEDKAAEVYIKLKSPEGYEKGGDIYFDRKEYQKAIDAYLAGSVTSGIKKYADYLYTQHRNEEADNLYIKLGEIMGTKKDDNALEKLAGECMKKGSYDLAARIYDKAGNTTMSDKCMGYEKLIDFDLDSAVMYFNLISDAAMSKTITDNTKLLTPLKDYAENLDDLMKLAPPVNMITDSVTGQSTPSASDQKLLDDYYKSVRDQVIKDVYGVSAGYAKLTDPDLKKYAHIRFMRYGAIRKILDPETFSIKKQKLDIKTQDVVL